MSIQTFEESGWQQSVVGAALRRLALLLVLAVVIAGPFLVGGAVAWMATREPGPVLGADGSLRSSSSLASNGAGFPLVSAGELEAAGLSVDEARQILRR